jgi:hypothetical protein
MKAFVLVAFAFACVSLDAQIIGILRDSPNGLQEVIIRNNSTVSLVAFVVSANQTPRRSAVPNTPLVAYFDPLVEPEFKPLTVNEERVVMRKGIGYSEPARASRENPGGRRLLQEPIGVAGILADGSLTGDPAMLTRLMVRRANMLAAVETSLEILLRAGRRNIPRDQLVAEFQRMVESVRRWYLPPEQQVGQSLYQSIIGKLTNLPEPPLGSAFPPSTFVAEETALLNRQRVILSESQPSLADGIHQDTSAHFLRRFP